MGRFARDVKAVGGGEITSYEELWRWSVEDLEGFWRAVWDHYDVQAAVPYERIVSSHDMPGARWFEGARLNYAENALRRRGDEPVVIGRSQTRGPSQLSWDELAEEVARVRTGLARLGVSRGDRVAAYLPNVPEAIVAFLATASLGATWSSCAPESGASAVLDRFSQIEPTMLLHVDGYRYGTRPIDRTGEVTAILAGLPTVRESVLVPYLDPGATPPAGGTSWEVLRSEAGPLEFVPVPADHPLYVLYSSGTTGKPKPIVHGHGGILLEHLKQLGLHADLGVGDRFLWFTTTGWMMWNLSVSALAVGSAVVVFDGDPAFPDPGALWRVAGETGTTWLGTSAPFLMACRRAGLRPREVADLDRLRAVGSTGAPLSAAGFRWVQDVLGPTVPLWSMSGGTDVCSAFVGGSPLMPVRAGEISCRSLGAAVAAFDPEGRSVVGHEGELVLTEPLPSMPVRFWDDPDGSRYRNAYFGRFPGVWCHGDWITITEHGSCIISGRSDATLNRGGVRLGTAEIYSVVESLDGVVDSLIVHDADPEGGPGALVLFVVLAEENEGIEALAPRIRKALQSTLSPRHAPDEVHVVPAVPTTLSGKKLEVPVKRILAGAPPDEVASRGALRDPSALDAVVRLAALRTRERANPA